MDILLYLTELLETNNAVGITGLGTLYKKKTPGKYDAIQHVFLPPTYQISFTPEVKEQQLLASHISRERNITIESAEYYIGEFAERIHAQLADDKEADLSSLGKLNVVDEEIVLTPTIDQHFGDDSFGLPPISDPASNAEISTEQPVEEQLAEIEEENKLEEENPGWETSTQEQSSDLPEQQLVEADVTPVKPEFGDQSHQDPPVKTLNSYEEFVRANLPPEEELEVDDEQERRTPFFFKFLVVFLIIVAAGAVAYFINPKFFDQYLQKNFESKPVKEVPTIKDSLTKTVDTNKVDSIANNNALVTLVKDSASIDSTKTIYEVMGTSESSKAAADAYIARVAKRGITAKHVKTSKIRFGVSLATFTNDKEALKYRDSIRLVLKNPGIYIKTITPKKHTK